jgi:hypothetical protein
MIVSAVVPHPPLLVPALATGTGAQFAGLLLACETALAALLAPAPELIVCVGDGAWTRRHPASAWGTLAGFGVDLRAPSAPSPAERATSPSLPLSLTLGRWLLERAGWAGPIMLAEVAGDEQPGECLALGHRLDQDAGQRAGWLVLGDGCSTRSERAPGYLDPRAEPFDAAVAAALATGDVAALTGLDPALAAELGAAGRAPWQVLAGGWGSRGPSAATIRYDDAPMGVGYFVANWWPG